MPRAEAEDLAMRYLTRVRIAEQHVVGAIAAVRVIGRVREVAGRLDRRHEPCIGEAFGERRALRDRVGEECFERPVTPLHVVRPDHGPDAGRTVGERDEPEPAVIPHDDLDVALALGVLAGGLGVRQVSEVLSAVAGQCPVLVGGCGVAELAFAVIELRPELVLTLLLPPLLLHIARAAALARSMPARARTVRVRRPGRPISMRSATKPVKAPP